MKECEHPFATRKNLHPSIPQREIFVKYVGLGGVVVAAAESLKNPSVIRFS
jgi:hypothetical protein